MLYPIDNETNGAVLVLWELECGAESEPFCRCDGDYSDKKAVIDELAADAPAGTVFIVERPTASRWLVYAHEPAGSGSPQ